MYKYTVNLLAICNVERFILDLYGIGKSMTWDEDISRYGRRLPTKSQALAMGDNYEAIYPNRVRAVAPVP